MKDILTKEQREAVEEIRQDLHRRRMFQDRIAEKAILNLLRILDSLKPPEPKQYTTEELLVVFDEWEKKTGWFMSQSGDELRGWIQCARFLGALKEYQDKSVEQLA
jgi:hypothetical protein